MKTKIAILISGRGSNMQAILEAAKDPDFPAEPVLVISNVPNVEGLQIAESYGITTCVINHKTYATREEFELELDKMLQIYAVNFVCLAGFMRVLSSTFIDKWYGNIINIHPALLPSYPGLHTHERALADKVKIHGCTVHFVVADVDAGPCIMQAAVPVLETDTPESLGKRVLR